MNTIEENHIESSINVKKIAITVFRGRVASSLESAKHLLLVTIEDEKIKSRELVQLRDEDPLRKIDVIFGLKPDIVICGELTNVCEYKLRHSNIKIISWVQGNVEYILSLCLNNAFIQGHYDESKYRSSYYSHS
jgi:predicted Fe-Mo cluster-binding NifX family protein